MIDPKRLTISDDDTVGTDCGCCVVDCLDLAVCCSSEVPTLEWPYWAQLSGRAKC